MIEFKFKKTLFGEVLMVKERYIMSTPGQFGTKWVKAKRDDIIKFTTDIELARKQIMQLKSIKEKHPEYIFLIFYKYFYQLKKINKKINKKILII